MSLKSFFNKAKGFFGRVWGGVKKGFTKVKDFVRKTITPIYNKVKPAINLIPGASAITGVVDKILPAVNSVSDDPNEAIKQGLKYAQDKYNNR